MLTYSQEKVFQMAVSTRRAIFLRTLLFLQEISFSSTVFNIHDVDTELTLNLLTEKFFLLRTPKLVIYYENQSHVKKSQKCFWGFEMFISEKKPQSSQPALRMSRIPSQSMAPGTTCHWI